MFIFHFFLRNEEPWSLNSDDIALSSYKFEFLSGLNTDYRIMSQSWNKSEMWKIYQSFLLLLVQLQKKVLWI